MHVRTQLVVQRAPSFI